MNLILIINAIFSWINQILATYLQLYVIDNFQVIDFYLFIGISGILIGFIVKKLGSTFDANQKQRTKIKGTDK